MTIPGSWRKSENTMRTPNSTTDDQLTNTTTGGADAPSATFERLRVAAASRATLLRAAHVRLEDDLRDLRVKASSSR